jgi:hypothetical protein
VGRELKKVKAWSGCLFAFVCQEGFELLRPPRKRANPVTAVMWLSDVVK